MFKAATIGVERGNQMMKHIGLTIFGMLVLSSSYAVASTKYEECVMGCNVITDDARYRSCVIRCDKHLKPAKSNLSTKVDNSKVDDAEDAKAKVESSDRVTLKAADAPPSRDVR
jgi:hypothetical protein